jgi:hypothetical protein
MGQIGLCTHDWRGSRPDRPCRRYLVERNLLVSVPATEAFTVVGDLLPVVPLCAGALAESRLVRSGSLGLCVDPSQFDVGGGKLRIAAN